MAHGGKGTFYFILYLQSLNNHYYSYSARWLNRNTIERSEEILGMKTR